MLTPSEIFILFYTAKGYSLGEIARMRGRSIKTIESQSANLRDDLGAKSLAHALILAIQTKQLRLEDL